VYTVPPRSCKPCRPAPAAGVATRVLYTTETTLGSGDALRRFRRLRAGVGQRFVVHDPRDAAAAVPLVRATPLTEVARIPAPPWAYACPVVGVVGVGGSVDGGGG
jgi:hypothetical protein